MMSPITAQREGSPVGTRVPLRTVAAALAGAIALIYGLLYLDVLSIEGATDGERGILGVAAGVFVVLGLLLWRRRSRLLWTAVVVIQVIMAAMYLAIAPDRDPAFEVWGVSIRALSFVLVVVIVKLWLEARRDRGGGPA
jgi:hypothetical protein